ncbi:MAG: hypothetical protein E6040_05925 [Lachnospiraceae bacterium]|nr:hypothetical protein [Lachnospiraceae bacterium]
MERILENTNDEVEVYDTDNVPLNELLGREMTLSRKWNGYYIFKLKSDDKYDSQVFIVNKTTKKVEWGYYTSLGMFAEYNGLEVTPEDIRIALI